MTAATVQCRSDDMRRPHGRGRRRQQRDQVRTGVKGRSRERVECGVWRTQARPQGKEDTVLALARSPDVVSGSSCSYSTSLKPAFSGFWSSMPHSQKILEPNSSEFHCGKGILRDERLQGAIFNLIYLQTSKVAQAAKSARRKLPKRGCFCF